MASGPLTRLAIAASVLLGLAGDAGAHLVSTGVGPFYDGAAHLFVSIEELLPVLAVSLLAGLRGPRAGRWVTGVLPAAWMAGGLVGPTVAATPPAMATTALLLLPGALLAADQELRLPAVIVLAALVGLSAGCLGGDAMAAANVGLPGLGGTTMAVLVVPRRPAGKHPVLGLLDLWSGSCVPRKPPRSPYLPRRASGLSLMLGGHASPTIIWTIRESIERDWSVH